MKQPSQQNWLPIWKYAENIGTSPQNVYRWIREGKMPTEAYKREQVLKERILVKEDFKRIT